MRLARIGAADEIVGGGEHVVDAPTIADGQDDVTTFRDAYSELTVSDRNMNLATTDATYDIGPLGR
jgi:hypothetical protein